MIVLVKRGIVKREAVSADKSKVSRQSRIHQFRFCFIVNCHSGLWWKTFEIIVGRCRLYY
jgi:hypothetical protein